MTVRKFRNTPTIIDGLRFDSKAEGKRWLELRLLERAGEITALERQKPYVLHGADGSKVAKFIADFDYIDLRNSVRVTEDVKSPATAKLPAFRMKAKLFEAQYGRPIQIIGGKK